MTAIIRTTQIVFKTFINLIYSLLQTGQSYLIPLVLVLAFLSILLFLLQVVSPLAPFVYSLF